MRAANFPSNAGRQLTLQGSTVHAAAGGADAVTIDTGGSSSFVMHAGRGATTGAFAAGTTSFSGCFGNSAAGPNIIGHNLGRSPSAAVATPNFNSLSSAAIPVTSVWFDSTNVYVQIYNVGSNTMGACAVYWMAFG